jgi:protein gp37
MCEQHKGLTDEHGKWTGVVRLVPNALERPLRWREPRTILWETMGDIFHDDVPDEYIAACFGVMAATAQHTHLVLTKRIGRVPGWLGWLDDSVPSNPARRPQAIKVGCCLWHADKYIHGRRGCAVHEITWPLPNVIICTTVEDQPRADERLPELAKVAALGWRTGISVEPLLGPVDLALHRWIRVRHPIKADWPISAVMHQNGEKVPIAGRGVYKAHSNQHGALSVETPGGLLGVMPAEMDRLHPEFVTVGAETGSAARPCRVDWIRSIVEQVRFAAGLSTIGYAPRCHVKSLGPCPLVTEQGLEEWGHWKRSDDPNLYQPIMGSRGGSDPDEWPEDLRVRELPRETRR